MTAKWSRYGEDQTLHTRTTNCVNSTWQVQLFLNDAVLDGMSTTDPKLDYLRNFIYADFFHQGKSNGGFCDD